MSFAEDLERAFGRGTGAMGGPAFLDCLGTRGLSRNILSSNVETGETRERRSFSK